VVSVENQAVLDTNVILKMFFQENDSDKADLLLSRFEAGRLQIVIPSFLLLELTNILWLRARHRLYTLAECDFVLDRFLVLAQKMRVIDLTPLLNRVLATSIHYDHAAYDIAFVELAESLEIPFITADAKLHRKASTRSQFVVLLKSLRFATD